MFPSWRLYTTEAETLSTCLWGVKWIRFFESCDCSFNEINIVDGTSFASGTKSYSSSAFAFSQSDQWAGLCFNREYWIGASLPYEANIHCISVQNTSHHKVNSLRVQKLNIVTGLWENVVSADNMNTGNLAVNIISLHDPDAVSNLSIECFFCEGVLAFFSYHISGLFC